MDSWVKYARVGQKVVCLANPPGNVLERYAFAALPHRGGVYTIRAINVWPHGTLIRLMELDNSRYANSEWSRLEPGFDITRFRPIQDTKKAVEKLIRLSLNTPVREDVEAM